mmetsp:Transcript_47349/g.139794  ORF Transcript_47349/g.139794 Transcript_47349/m.139794 type:complete len:263 (+) Transcript_47349:1743-2531(+)
MQAVRMAPRRPEAVFELLLDARVHERDPHRAEVEARSVLSRLEGAHRVAVPPQAVQRLALLRSVVPRADAVRPPVGIELPIVPKASVGHAEPRIERPHDLGEVEEFGRLQRHRLDAKVPLQIVERPPFALHRARVEHVDKVPREHSEDLETQRQPEVDVQILLVLWVVADGRDALQHEIDSHTHQQPEDAPADHLDNLEGDHQNHDARDDPPDRLPQVLAEDDAEVDGEGEQEIVLLRDDFVRRGRAVVVVRVDGRAKVEGD